MNRLRFRISLVLQVLAVAVCACMVTVGRAQSSDVKIAVLETRTDQIDAHLRNTDQNLQSIDNKLDKLSESIAEMQGTAEMERFGGWSICVLLSGSSMVVGFKRKREE